MARNSIIGDGAPSGNEPMGAINVTSLVDVMFCLLIMFMVATPLSQPPVEENVELPPGRGEQMTEADFDFSTISIDKTGKVYLGAVALSPDKEKMVEEIAANTKLTEDGLVFIQGDKNVDFKRIVDVLAALKEAKIPDVGFVTHPNPEQLREVPK